jgi:hypothetical protein
MDVYEWYLFLILINESAVFSKNGIQNTVILYVQISYFPMTNFWWQVWEDYGEVFGKNDTVGAFLDITEDTVTITFTKNGQTQARSASSVLFVVQYSVLPIRIRIDLDPGGGKKTHKN